MAKTIKIEAEALYRVEVQEKCSAGGLALRPGATAILVGTVVSELGEKVKVLDKFEG